MASQSTDAAAAAAFSLLTASAFAADLEMPIKTPPAPPPFTWTGCYAGGQVGGGWGQKDLNDSAGIISPGAVCFSVQTID